MGTRVGRFTTADRNRGDRHTYRLVSGPGAGGNGSFRIAGSTLVTRTALDFERKASYSIRVRVTDGRGGMFEKAFRITVEDVGEAPANQAPTDISLSGSTLGENEAPGTPVGTLSASDPDAGDTHTYRLASGTGDADNASFRISGSTLETDAALDHEAKPSYSARVRATDNKGGTFEKVFAITVANANDPPTDISLSPSSVAENKPAGEEVGTLSTTDQDAGDPHTYSLVSGAGDADNGSFQITGDNLETHVAFDFEVKASYSIRVRTDDGNGRTFEKSFTVTVNNANESPTDISLSPSSVAENKPAGEEVGTLSTTDQDAGDPHTYSLVSGAGDADNGSFRVNGSKLETDASLDFEQKSSFSIRVETEDGDGEKFEKALTVTVTNVNDPPTDISLSPSSVAENKPAGEEVGTLSATDPDAGDTHTYRLASGAGDADNGSFRVNGSKLETDASLDFEQKSSFSIRVETEDGDGEKFEKALTVTVTNVNDPPTDISLSSASVDENKPSGTMVGTLSTSDEDAGDTHAYSLVAGAGDADNASFQITGDKLETKAAFNFEVKSSYSIRVRSTDSGNASTEKELTVTVNDVNDAPIADDESFTATNRAVGNTSLVVNDPDDGAPNRGGPEKTITGDILAGDSDEDGSGSLAVAAETKSTNDGGTVVIEGDGDFTFHPRAGTSCTDHSDFFDYTVSDQNTTKPPGTPATDTGRVTIEIQDCVWYVDIAASSNGDGRSHSPFNTLNVSGGSGLNGAGGAGDSDAPGQKIFLYDGNYSGGLPLEDSQTLLGQRHGLSVPDGGAGNVTLAPAGGSSTTITGGLALGQNDTIQGIRLGNNTGAALSGTNVGTATMNTATPGAIDNQSGKAVDVSNGTLNMTFSGVSSKDSSSDGIRLDNVAGTFNASGGSIQNAADQDINLSGNNSGDTANVTYGGSITDDRGTLVKVSNQNGGVKEFSGAISDGNDGDGSGISLTNNGGATANFTSGSVQLDTGSSDAFRATGGGTVSVTGSGNTLGATSGSGLFVQNTTIGASGLNFKAITSNGGSNTGIVLDNTGSSGGLSVTGSGTAGSGGTIANKAGADGSTTTGVGVYLNNTRSVSLSRMQLNDFENFAVRGYNVDGFTLANSVVSAASTAGDCTADNANGDNASLDEGSIYFGQAGLSPINGLTGAASLAGSSISGACKDNLRVENSGGTLNRLVLNDTTIGANNTNQGNDGVTLEATGGVFNVTVENDTDFTSARGDLFQHEVVGNAQSDLDFTGNDLSNNHPAIAQGGGGVTIGAANSGDLTYDVTGNELRDSLGTALAIGKGFGGVPGDGTATGKIESNVIGVSGTPNSGSDAGSGIEVGELARGSHTTLIRGNQVRRYSNFGILMSVGGAAQSVTGLTHDGAMNATVQGNTVAEPNAPVGGLAQNGIHLNSGTNSPDAYQVCLGLGDPSDAAKKNTVSGSGALGGTDYRLRQRFDTVVRMPGYTGVPNDPGATGALDSALTSYLTPRTNGPFTLSSTSDPPGGFFNTTPAGSACPQP